MLIFEVWPKSALCLHEGHGTVLTANYNSLYLGLDFALYLGSDLAIILDSKLSFSAHIQAAINKSRKAIGVLKFMSKYLPRNTLNELYKLYVRPHVDYGDVIYHIPQGMDVSENYMMEKLESVQYSAALAVTGTWRGTSRERLYNELGWESLSSRRWSRRLILLYKFINNLTPDYTRDSTDSTDSTPARK